MIMKSKLYLLAATWLVFSDAQTQAGDTNSTASATLAAEEAQFAPGTIIPLILMDEIPLTDAIRNLTRQASLNFILDPKVQFGQPGPDGKPMPQPSVTLRWNNVTAQQALQSLLAAYGLQIVEDPNNKIARITTKDPTALPPLKSKIIQLEYASPTNVLQSLQTLFQDKRSKVVADIRTSQLVVLATEQELLSVDELIHRLDTATKQVLIEARLIETSMNPSTKKGIDWSGTLNEQNLSFGNNASKSSSASSGTDGVLAGSGLPKMLFDTSKGFNPSTAFLNADGVNAALSFLNKNAEAKVLSTPRAVTLDNETASISVTRASPIFKNTAGTQGSPGGSEVTYTNLGVILSVTPRIAANNQVNLRVVPEVSRVFETVSKKVNDLLSQADTYDIRKIETHVMIPSGNTLVLGGLVQDDIRQNNTKVPLLGDIPGLGRAFRTDSKSRQKSNLIIFITPTIIEETDFQPTETKFLKSAPPLKDGVEEDWSSWDSGKPKEWKKAKTPSAAGEEDPKFAPVPPR